MAGNLDHLRQRLQMSRTLASCAQTVCDHLVALGHPMPSIYLSRSGRLRCFGAAGYFQVRDGFPPLTGVISATVRTGQPHVVNARDSDIYVMAAETVESEVCVPILADGITVGALNIESPLPLPAEVLDLALEVAAVFAERMADLGGIPPPTGWQFVADQATRLVEMDRESDLYEATLDIALQLSGTESGMVAIGDTTDGFTAVTSRGGLAGELIDLPAESLTEIGRWVETSLSCYTFGTRNDEWFPGFERLRRAGLGTLIITALVRGGEQLGYFIVADQRGSIPSTELIEQLELLASLTTSALSNARHVAALREMARRDPLTGLGHHLAFGDALHRARERHHKYAVLVIDVDHFKSVNDTHGHEHGDRVLRDLATSMQFAIRAQDALYRVGGDEFAAIVVVESEDEAMGIAQRLADAARTAGVPVSIGVAFNGHHHHSDLYARADEALYRAKRAGRNRALLAHITRSGD